MDSERWKQVDSVLQSALDRAPEERDSFLRGACMGDETLEREVRSLLTSEEQVGRFLENPAIDVAARAIAVHQEDEIPEPTGSLAGQTISHYRILEKLGAGGMGDVWKAWDQRLDRFVALKFLPAARMGDPERRRRFVQEARAASALNHPNIITIHDIEHIEPDAGPADFIAMELVPGKALNQLIPRKGLRLSDALKYAIQVAEALAAAHAAGIVHRDLKPGNVMVTESGCVKVLDFGLAKLIDQGSFTGAGTMSEVLKTEEGAIVGTVSYMSPEQAEGKKVDARTDIFSFGAMLYETITGRRAFDGDSMASIMSAILRDEPKPAAEIVPGLPREIEKIITRCLKKDPNRRYQHAGDLKIDLEQISEELAAGGSVREEEPGGLRARRWWWLATTAVCMTISLAAVWWVRSLPTAPSYWKLTRLTSDAGLATSPALSSDGKLLAYASDGGRDSGLDLYVKQSAGGQPIRLTSDGADNREPDFSPDGSKIVFQSNRDGVPGIYEIPAFGGAVRLLVRDGLLPRFSPDGSTVGYWAGSERMVQTAPGSAAVWVVPAAGGQPQRVKSNYTAARAPIWSPDGKRLLFIGYTSAKLYDDSSLDWWLAAPDGGEAVKTGVHDALIRAGLPVDPFPIPSCWSADTNTVLFCARAGDAVNIWEIGLSPRTGKMNGVLRRLTAGAGIEDSVSCASGDVLAFNDRESRSNVWFLPFDLNRGTPAGAPERITQGPADRRFASLPKNGRSVAFSSNQSGPTNIWRRDLATGNESIVASSSSSQRFPVMSPSGARIAFAVYEKDGKVTVYMAAPGAEPEKLFEESTRATDWSNDEKTLLVFGGNPYQINILDVASHRQTPLLKHPTYNLLYGRFSPDNRWVSFTARTQPNHGRIEIAPLDGPKPVPESAWITIAEAGTTNWANWSPDGKTLYFTSPRDGHICLWGQRIDGVSHRPVGEAFAAWHFHGREFYQQQDGWSVGGGRIAIVLREDTGNIWMMSRAGGR